MVSGNRKALRWAESTMSANFQLFGLSESSVILGLTSIALLLSIAACNHIQSYTSMEHIHVCEKPRTNCRTLLTHQTTHWHWRWNWALQSGCNRTRNIWNATQCVDNWSLEKEKKIDWEYNHSVNSYYTKQWHGKKEQIMMLVPTEILALDYLM